MHSGWYRSMANQRVYVFVPFFLFQNVYAFVVIRKAKGGGDVNKPQLILGVHDLPRPRGEGFLYYKLYPGYHERILVYFNLYNTEEQELKGYFSKGIRVMLESADFTKNGDPNLLNNYGTENLQDWSAKVLAEVIDPIKM